MEARGPIFIAKITMEHKEWWEAGAEMFLQLPKVPGRSWAAPPPSLTTSSTRSWHQERERKSKCNRGGMRRGHHEGQPSTFDLGLLKKPRSRSGKPLRQFQLVIVTGVVVWQHFISVQLRGLKRFKIINAFKIK